MKLAISLSTNFRFSTSLITATTSITDHTTTTTTTIDSSTGITTCSYSRSLLGIAQVAHDTLEELGATDGQMLQPSKLDVSLLMYRIADVV